MGHPATTGEEIPLTEFEALEVERVDGVKAAANGYTHLIMKGLADDAAKADAPADHDAMTGKHTHAHPSYGAADGPHRHQHEHQNDKNHHHSHAGLQTAPAGQTGKGLPAWHSPAALLVRLGLQERDTDRAALYKAVAADGTIDEQPDIDDGQKAIALVAQLIQYEAAELAAGHTGEIRDISQLLDAAQALKWWISGEIAGQAAAEGDGVPCPCGCGWTVVAQGLDAITDGFCYLGQEDGPDELAKANREFSAADRKKNAKAGNALPDGSYPIPDKDALRRAAILARSKHGNWKAAEKLIARRAKELGVPNPLDEKADAGKGVVAPGEAGVDTVPVGDGASKGLTADDLAKAMAPLRQEIDDLRAFKARVERMPRPGGPVVSAAALTAQAATSDGDWAAKAAYYREMAGKVTDRTAADGYRALAREADAKAAAPQT